MSDEYLRNIDQSLSQLLRVTDIQGTRQESTHKKLDELAGNLATYAAELRAMGTQTAVMETKMGESINDRLDLWRVAQQHEQEIHQIKSEIANVRGVAIGVSATSKMFWVVGAAIVAGVISTIGLFIEVFKILNTITGTLPK